MIAPDDTTFNYLKGKEFAPSGKTWDHKLAYWKTLFTDSDAKYDVEHYYNAKDIEPMITYGTNPGMGIGITGTIPALNGDISIKKSLEYMDLQGGSQLLGKKIDYVFIGSCTNSRIEDLRLVANLVKGRKKADHVNAMIVPGSRQVEKQAIEEGIDKILAEAGFELRQAGCSACLGMNEDKVPKGKYCVSTSNRNFEGRQGPGARTMLASPLTAAAAALTGHITDVRELMN
jgi:3-isopropylmalate/(R)-2-methylmalate dehydratase large subunit